MALVYIDFVTIKLRGFWQTTILYCLFFGDNNCQNDNY